MSLKFKARNISTKPTIRRTTQKKQNKNPVVCLLIFDQILDLNKCAMELQSEAAQQVCRIENLAGRVLLTELCKPGSIE